jgi:hypothetical protein
MGALASGEFAEGAYRAFPHGEPIITESDAVASRAALIEFFSISQARQTDPLAMRKCDQTRCKCSRATSLPRLPLSYLR